MGLWSASWILWKRLVESPEKIFPKRKQKLERVFELQDIPDLTSPLHSHLAVLHDVQGTLSQSVGSTDKTDAAFVPAVPLQWCSRQQWWLDWYFINPQHPKPAVLKRMKLISKLESVAAATQGLKTLIYIVKCIDWIFTISLLESAMNPEQSLGSAPVTWITLFSSF